MKLRFGFVSNSSTSSFLLITTDEFSDKALKKMSKEEQALMTELLASSKFLGKNIVEYYEHHIYDGWYVNGEDLSDLSFKLFGDKDDFDEDDRFSFIIDTAEKWCGLVKKLAPKDSVYIKETDG